MPRLPLVMVVLALLAGGCARAQPDDDRTEAMYLQWRPMKQADIAAFEAFLSQHGLLGLVPTWQLLRSASMWKECQAAPFEVPPREHWVEVGRVLALLQELRRTNSLGPFAVVSAYRGPRLNKCAGGSPGSSHLRFAVDIVPLSPADDQKLCGFWRSEGMRWDMGLSRYPSGRIHVDRTGWRSWGSDYSSRTSFCNQKAEGRVRGA